MDIAADVVFDFEGSLQLARKLWAVADQLEKVRDARVGLAADALVSWTGPHGVDFAGRANLETTQATVAAGQLREGATLWATAWKAAMDEQNWINMQREKQRVKDDRNWAQDQWASWTGDDDMPADPAEVTVPSAPSFAATSSLITY